MKTLRGFVRMALLGADDFPPHKVIGIAETLQKAFPSAGPKLGMQNRKLEELTADIRTRLESTICPFVHGSLVEHPFACYCSKVQMARS